jgi:preprotein translocase subunit SecG
MMQVLLVVHLIVTVVMIGLILLQRSEGGGLGIGGGNGGMGAFAGPRATANILTKATMWCFFTFVALSLILAIMAGSRGSSSSLIDQLNAPVPAAAAPAATTPMTPAEPMKSKDIPAPPAAK